MIGRKRFRPAEQQLDAGVEEAGDTPHRLVDMGIHALPVGRNFAEAEVLRNALRPPRPRLGFEQAHHDLARLLADVGRVAGIAQDRQQRMHAGHGLGDQVIMLGRLQRHVHAGHPPDGARPHAGAVDDDLRAYIARVGTHARRASVLAEDPDHRCVLEYARAALARALRQSLGHVGRIHPRIVRKVKRRLQIAHIRKRPHALHFGGRNLVRIDAEAMRHVDAPPHLLRLVRGHRQLDRPAIDDAGCLAGLRLEPPVQVLRIFRKLGLRLRVAQRGQQSRGVPGGSRGELRALEEHDVAPAELGEVIGDRAADHAATDDHHARLLW